MGLKFIDFPTFIEADKYDILKAKIVSDLKSKDVIKSIYQMGSVREPGISDLDIICVFKNGSSLDLDYRSTLSENEKAILTHGLFGIEKRFFAQSMNYGLVSNLNLLHGENLNYQNQDSQIDHAIKIQIAFEYLVKMFISLDVQVTLGIIKLRSFLLEARAIFFDLELLGVKEGKLYDCVETVIAYRKAWFEKDFDVSTLSELILLFHKELGDFLKSECNAKNFYLPVPDVKLPLNYRILMAQKFYVKHKGIVLPNLLSFLGRKYINLQTRFNTFTYHIPFDLPKNDSAVEMRFKFYENLVKVNTSSYRHFIPLTTSLSIF
ncbi:hypothetical protein [Winogradskyella sp. KYW1333]|uniref:hypothetical protein n=1 Tax=Winogradskyella sp. KYW1333 TaxID=2282123 RepID=UPI000DF329D4|nr:hypothetical protein [Winogradskyella sp. KYW1333]RCT55354.1 hypothetical protein DUZ96_03425 [Winogradskyella sp. KYW1333]